MPAEKRRVLTRRRLLGIDRSGPEPPQTRAGQPLRPFTAPNLIGYIRLAAIPVFLVIALSSGDGRDALASVIFLAIALGDLLDGFVARVTGQYSRLGALLDPVVDRLTILAGAVVCWHFELLPRAAIVILAVREVATLLLARYGLRHGADLEITWVGRIAVFLIMGGIFWSMVLDWTIIEVGFCVGVALAVIATILYVRSAGRRIRAAREPVQSGVQPSSSD
ncbi:MAG TPA: CDP-alcohol phosphatidyltransferase family protein [Solirubrobacterales bacterium]|nr:CDP-alcohol phosphatidyltransferase family protein [Solirubrobacterales bacterium]